MTSGSTTAQRRQLEVQNDMNTQLAAPASDPTAAQRHLSPRPANDAIVSGNRTITADASDDVGVAGVQFYVDGDPAWGRRTRPLPMRLNWDTRAVANGAHTLTARARDTDGKTTLSAACQRERSPTATTSRTRSSRPASTCRRTSSSCPTAACWSRSWRARSRSCRRPTRRRTRPRSCRSPTSGPTGCSRGSWTSRSIPTSPPTATTTSSTRWARRTRDRLSRFTANATLTGTVAGSEVILYQDPQAADPASTTAVPIELRQRRQALLHDRRALRRRPPSQDLTNPRGKIHRINKDGTVPTDNPFYDGAGPDWDSIWAYGLRNPFRAYFDGADQPALHRRRRRQHGQLQRGAERRRPRAPTTAGRTPRERARHPARALSTPTRTTAATHPSPAASSTTAPSSRPRCRAATSSPTTRRTGSSASPSTRTATSAASSTSSRSDGYAERVRTATSSTSPRAPTARSTTSISATPTSRGTFGVSKIRRIRYLQSNQAPVRDRLREPDVGYPHRSPSTSRAQGRTIPRASRSRTRGTSATAPRPPRATPSTPTPRPGSTRRG